MASFDADLVLWTVDMSVRQFVDNYKDHLPTLIRTTSGYRDCSGCIDICSEEVFWVYGMEQQTRIAAENDGGRFASIPLSSVHRFQMLTSPYMDLEALIESGKFEGIRIGPATDKAPLANLISTSAGSSKQQLGHLEIVDSYTEYYLLTRSLIDDVVCWEPVSIPVYLPIKVQVAVGFVNGNTADFSSWLQSMKSTSDSCQQLADSVQCEDILLFDKCPCDDYEYVEPTSSKYSPSPTSEQCSSTSSPMTGHLPYATEPLPYLSKNNNASGSVYISNNDYVTVRPIDESAPRVVVVVVPVNRTGTESVSSTTSTLPSTRRVRPPAIQRRMKSASSKQNDTKLSAKDELDKRTDSSDIRESNAVASVFRENDEVDQNIHRDAVVRSEHIAGLLQPVAGEDFTQEDRFPFAYVTSSSPITMTSPSSAFSPTDTWGSLADVPLNVEDFSVEQLGRSLELLRMPRLAAAFAEQFVDGKLMLNIVTEESLLSDFQCTKFEAQKLLLFAKNKWRPK